MILSGQEDSLGGVYGIALGYKHTGREDLIEKLMQVTDVFLKHLPEDNIPAWALSKLSDECLQKAVDMLQALCDSMHKERSFCL